MSKLEAVTEARLVSEPSSSSWLRSLAASLYLGGEGGARLNSR